jgi:hypothetical protein
MTSYASGNPQLSKLWRREFERSFEVFVLRIPTRNDCLPIVFWHDVHWQQTLPTLWRGSGDSGRYE